MEDYEKIKECVDKLAVAIFNLQKRINKLGEKNDISRM